MPIGTKLAGQFGFGTTIGALWTCVTDAARRWGTAERAGSRDVVRSRTSTRASACIGRSQAANGASNRGNVVIDVIGKEHIASIYVSFRCKRRSTYAPQKTRMYDYEPWKVIWGDSTWEFLRTRLPSKGQLGTIEEDTASTS